MQRVAFMGVVFMAIAFVAWPRHPDCAAHAERASARAETPRVSDRPSFGVVASPRSVARASMRRPVRTSGPGVMSGTVRDGGILAGGASVYGIAISLPGRHAARGEDIAVETEADAQGRFHFDEVSPGDFALWAVWNGRSSALFMPLSITPGETLDGIELELVGPSVADGVVVDPEANRIDAYIEVFVGELRVEAAGTEKKGPFHLDHLPCEPLTLVARAFTGLEPDEYEARLHVPAPTRSLVLRLAPVPSSLTVEVRDEAGQPARGASVQVVVDQKVDNGLTDEVGLAHFAHLRGHARVTASDDGSELASDAEVIELDGESERTLRLVLRDSPCAHGRVLDSDDKPAVGYVQLEEVGPHLLQLNLLEPDGSYSACVGRAGHFRASFQPYDREERDLSGSVGFDFEVVPGLRTLPDVHLPLRRTLRGVVLDEEGAPSAFSSITAYSLFDGDELGVVMASEDGHFTMHAVGPVRIVARDVMSSSRPVEIRGTADETVTLTLEGQGVAEIVVRGAPPGARIRCGSRSWEELGSSGQATLSCRADDSVDVQAGLEQRAFAVSVEPGESTYVELRWD